MTSETTTIDVLKFKITVRQSCLHFGAYETAKKIVGNSEKFNILIDLLIEEDLAQQAYMLGTRFLSEEDLIPFKEREEFSDIPEGLEVSQLSGDLHE